MSKKPPQTKVKHRISAIIFGSVLLILGTTVGFQAAFAGKVMPNTLLLNSSVGFEEAEKIQIQYHDALTKFEQKPITMTFKGQPYTFTLEELGVALDKQKSIQSIPVVNLGTPLWGKDGLFRSKKVEAMFQLDTNQFQKALSEKIIDLNMPVQEAKVVWDTKKNDLQILAEQVGWEPIWPEFEQRVRRQVAELDSSLFDIPVKTITPKMTAADLESQRDFLKAKLTQVTMLSAPNEQWKIQWKDHVDRLTFQSIPQASTTQIRMGLQPETESMLKELIGSLEQPAQNVTILQDEGGKISFEGTATQGISVRYDLLTQQLEQSFNERVEGELTSVTIEIPREEQKAQVNAPKALQDLGIIELVSTGYTTFNGSPTNRRHNIGVAISRFNGVLIQPGEEFSFGNQLGAVDGSTGYRKELVIKADRTIPEYGGGVCQVSSTMYRAALYGGFPMVKRNPHSYAVSYYAYPSGYGLDATVYPPHVDLVFKNDMTTPILIQSYVTDASEAYFKFYGTSDGRQVVMEGPTIYNRVAAPATQYIETTELAPGEKKKIDGAHNGFTASWKRIVTYADGRVVEETIVSPYEARGEKWQVGAQPAPTEPVEATEGTTAEVTSS